MQRTMATKDEFLDDSSVSVLKGRGQLSLHILSRLFRYRYNPSTDLETGLGHFVKWYLDYYGQGSKNEASLQGYKPY